MYILIIILQNESLIRKLVSVLIELGLFEATIMEGESIENFAARTIPVFSSLRGLFGDDFVYHKTVLTPVENRRTIDQVLDLCRRQGIDFEQKDVGTFIALPCELWISGGN